MEEVQGFLGGGGLWNNSCLASRSSSRTEGGSICAFESVFWCVKVCVAKGQGVQARVTPDD